MYLDSAYLVKYYVNEPDAAAARRLIGEAASLYSSALAMIEVTCLFRRLVRDGFLSPPQGLEATELFMDHIDGGLWNLVPISGTLLRTTLLLLRGLPPNVPLRAGDAIHLASALAVGEREIWTTDRHLLAAAAHVGLVGRFL